jgi:hypothetical protein
MARRTSLIIELTVEERRELESMQRSTTSRAGLVKRARIVLLRADGLPISHIAIRVGIRRRHVDKWLNRFLQDRIAGLKDKSGRGRKPFFPSAYGCAPGQARVRAA